MSARRVWKMISTPLTLVVLIGMLGFGMWWGYKEVTAAVPPRPETPCVTMPMTDLLPSSVTVRVYNGGDMRGLATTIGKALREGGFIVATVGNTDTRARDTVIIGASADSPEVQLVAAWFKNPEIQADGRANHTVDVMVGNEYSGMADSPPTSLPLPSGEVCLPDTATPTPSEEATDESTEEPAEEPTSEPT